MLAWATGGGSPSLVYMERVYRRPLSKFRTPGSDPHPMELAVALKRSLLAPPVPSPAPDSWQFRPLSYQEVEVIFGVELSIVRIEI